MTWNCCSLRYFFVIVIVANFLTIGCGNPTDSKIAIVGGRALRSSDPARSSLVAFRKLDDSVPFCSGVLIASDLVLTAAHCLRNSHSEDLLVSEASDLPEAKSAVRVHDMLIYSGAETRFSPNGDIAWVRLESPLSPRMEPIAIMTDSSQIAEGNSVLIAGVGQQEVECTSLQKDCLGKAYVTEMMVKSVINNHYFRDLIILDSPEQKGSCRGDSGGPAYVKLGDRWFLAGIANGKSALLTPEAFSNSAVDCGVGGDIYTSLGGYTQWIKSTTSLELSSSSHMRRTLSCEDVSDEKCKWRS